MNWPNNDTKLSANGQPRDWNDNSKPDEYVHMFTVKSLHEQVATITGMNREIEREREKGHYNRSMELENRRENTDK